MAAKDLVVRLLVVSLMNSVWSSAVFERQYGLEQDDVFPEEDANDVEDGRLSRPKRYTDIQERASAYCTGICMFLEQMPYSYCFDLCNWNGRQPNPWEKHQSKSLLTVLKDVASRVPCTSPLVMKQPRRFRKSDFI